MQILIGWLGRWISWAIFCSPPGLRRTLARGLGFLWYDILRIRRQVVLDNLRLAFPTMSLIERTQLGRRSLFHLGLNLIEYSFLPWLTAQNYERYFGFDNLELFDRALHKNRGLLLLTLHMGHGDLACGALSLRGYQVVMVSKFFKLRWLNDLWFGMRERLGTRFIPPRDSSYPLLKALKQGKIVVIPLDQFTGPPIGVRTTFFGHETGTAAGLAVMAARSGAPVVACYTAREPSGRHVLHFMREMPTELSKDPNSVTKTTQGYNDELEKFVRLYPDQWMWIHRRWKRFVVQ